MEEQRNQKRSLQREMVGTRTGHAQFPLLPTNHGEYHRWPSMARTEVFHKGGIFKMLDLMNYLADTHWAILCTATGLCPQVVTSCVQETLPGSGRTHGETLALRVYNTGDMKILLGIPSFLTRLTYRWTSELLFLRRSPPTTSSPGIRSGTWVSAKLSLSHDSSACRGHSMGAGKKEKLILMA